MRYYLVPLILSLSCGHAMASFERFMEVTGGVLCFNGALALGTIAVAAGCGTGMLGAATVDRVGNLGHGTTIPEACGYIVATCLTTGATAMVAGMALEAGAYGVSMIASSERPPITLLSLTGSIIKFIAEHSGKHQTHTHYHYRR